ncbi:MAG: glutathione synthetase [Alphaproteobacteria bacterium]|nr:glutathione synthetase [Hyphomonas sp.]MBR9808359.1 glutathione synthetase [Alphaproteobacteria bacterium]
MSDSIGLMAAALTTLSFLPQALLVIRTRQTRGISLIMYIMFTTGVAAWLVYGIMEQSLPMILANSVTLVLAMIILGLKVWHSLQARTQGATESTSAPIAS